MHEFDTCHVSVQAEELAERAKKEEEEEEEDEDQPICWICMSSDTSQHPLEQPCTCPRYAHRPCLAQWQIVSAGKSEEVNCRFCNKTLPDWRDSLADKPRATPVMTVYHNDRHHVLKVEPGEQGRLQFEQEIRDIYGLTQNDNISVTFGIKEPFSGSDVTLNGWGAWSAAVECAACSAGSRPAKEESREECRDEPLLPRAEENTNSSCWRAMLYGCLQTMLGWCSEDESDLQYIE